MNKLSKNEVNRVLETTAQLKTITPSAVEKDVFVTRAIEAISKVDTPYINLVFCGGTCLAKAYQIVGRMSEDVDFKIYPVIPFASHSDQNKKLKKFKHEVTEVLKDIGFEITEKNLNSRDKHGYTIYRLNYESHFDKHPELRPHIQIELTLAQPRLETKLMSIASLVDQTFPDEKIDAKKVNCISVLETAAEKWVAITRRISSISRGHDRMDETLVRHLYDLEAITRSYKLTHDFFYLVCDTIERDKSKFKRHLEYCADPIKEINFSLKILKNEKIWRQNFDNFLEAMVFRKENISFKKCYENLQKISEKIFQYFEHKHDLKKSKEMVKSPMFSKDLIKNLKLYIELQVKLQKVCDEKLKNTDPEKSDKLHNNAMMINGRIIKLANEIIKMQEISKNLSQKNLAKNHSTNKQAIQILERFQKNEISIKDINLILCHAQKNAQKLSKNIGQNLKF